MILQPYRMSILVYHRHSIKIRFHICICAAWASYSTTWNGVLVGYGEGRRGYRIWNPITDEVCETRHVKIEENVFFMDSVNKTAQMTESLEKISSNKIVREKDHLELLYDEWTQKRILNSTSDSGNSSFMPTLSSSSEHSGNNGNNGQPEMNFLLMPIQTMKQTTLTMPTRFDLISELENFKDAKYEPELQLSTRTESEAMFNTANHDLRQETLMTSQKMQMDELHSDKEFLRADTVQKSLHDEVGNTKLIRITDSQILLLENELKNKDFTITGQHSSTQHDNIEYNDSGQPLFPRYNTIVRQLEGQYADWTREESMRQYGKERGRVEVCYISHTGSQLMSLREVDRFRRIHQLRDDDYQFSFTSVERHPPLPPILLSSSDDDE
uniref:Uncharacterized protein n=1 Tax=Strigamia maritima TaxID=126957 RepID=T1J5R5_STRMM